MNGPVSLFMIFSILFEEFAATNEYIFGRTIWTVGRTECNVFYAVGRKDLDLYWLCVYSMKERARCLFHRDGLSLMCIAKMIADFFLWILDITCLLENFTIWLIFIVGFKFASHFLNSFKLFFIHFWNMVTPHWIWLVYTTSNINFVDVQCASCPQWIL